MHDPAPSRDGIQRRWVLRRGAAAAVVPLAPLVLVLSGCAALNSVSSEVASFGPWPAGRAPGTFAFDRLPSQAANPQAQSALEDAARPALAAAGFTAAAPGTQAEFLVQLGARVTRTERSPWDDPLWWRGPMPSWRWAPWGPTPWPVWPRRYRPPGPSETRYDHEVAVLIRERASGLPLFEARAVNDGLTNGGMALIGAMFAAAMKGFPNTQPTPTRVVVPVVD